MIIRCDQCGKKYRIDEAKLKPGTTRLKCKSCADTILIQKGRPEPPASDFSTPPPTAHEKTIPPSDVEESLEEEGYDDFLPPDVQKVRFGLFPKLILLMLIISLVPFCFFWGITFQETSKRIQQGTEDLMGQTTEGLMTHVDEWLDKNILVLKAAAKLSDIVSMNRRRQEAVLKSISSEYPWMYLVFTVGPDGINVARDDGKPLKDYSDRQYYKDIMEGKPLTWQTLIGKTSKKPALVVAVPIKKGDVLVGVMAAAMTVDDISKSVAKWKKGETGYAFLVDEKGKVVAHQRKEFVLTQKNMNTHPLVSAFRQNPQPLSLGFSDPDGKQPTQGYIRGNAYGWALAVVQQDFEVFAGLKQIRNLAIILLLLTVVVVVLIAWFSARAVVTPVMKLTSVAERMSLGQLDAEISVNSKDEIGLLAQALGRMQISLRLALERLRR
jgi:methyl-accepting chemotaxis protein